MKNPPRAGGMGANGGLSAQRDTAGGLRIGGMMPASDIEHNPAASLKRDTELQLDRTAELEALLREALIWCPRIPTHPTSAKRQAVGKGWCDLGNRIQAALAENVAETG
jgi:hypothetical protein